MRTKEQKVLIFFFLAPAVVMYGLFVLLPAVNALWYSLTNWDGLTAPQWAGLKNFRMIATQRAEFVQALKNNLFLIFVPGIFILTISLYFAYVLHRGTAGARLFRVTYFFPNVISFVAISLLWTLIYSTTKVGLLNYLLQHWFGYPADNPIPFTESSRLVKSLMPMMVWGATGFYMVLFLAAMQNIPESLYEAARLDGAGNWRNFWHITFPLIWDVLTTGIVYLVIGGLKIFDYIWVMENGRPKNESHTIATLMYQTVFQEYRIGYGTAIAVLLFVLILLATIVSFRLLQRERLEY
ncbi:MAG: sugar ABC transporter permease [Armatimonadetes bacterium]|nr:sugar ABC transporter permease [Armatimonadota bacterium]